MKTSQGMNGQWMGSYSGSSQGRITLNIDELAMAYDGVAFLFDEDPTLPISVASFSTPHKAKEIQFRTNFIGTIDPTSGSIVTWESVASKLTPGVTFAKYADVAGSCGEDALTLSWVTDKNTTGTCVLPRSKAGSPSEIEPLQQDWATYKRYVADLIPKRYLFRGQKEQGRLRTPFHRRGRADLHRFVVQDIPVLHRHLSARTRHVFNLEIPDQNGAFYNLIQHHGYPTPLLDWTYSPYAAAFFAYRELTNDATDGADPDKKVRIFIFDQAEWTKDLQQLRHVLFPWPNFSVCEFMAIENERMIPQQAASTITNIDDIETYIRSREVDLKKNYLRAIDLPKSERRWVIRELSYMGITAGSLFPGLDGACEELTERNFQF